MPPRKPAEPVDHAVNAEEPAAEAPAGKQPAWLDGKGAQGRRAKKHEERFAKTLKGRRYPRSGGAAWSPADQARSTRHIAPTRTAKGDIRTPELHIEHKHTVNESIGVTRAWLRKVTDGAKQQARVPALGLTYAGETGCPADWVLIPLSYLETLLELKKIAEEEPTP